jgi:hypothetical protein
MSSAGVGATGFAAPRYIGILGNDLPPAIRAVFSVATARFRRRPLFAFDG